MNNLVVRQNRTNLAYEYCYAHSEKSYPRPVLDKGVIKTADYKLVETGNTTAEGVLSLQSQVQINNTKYNIERAFNGVKTPAMLIEERVFNHKSKNIPLTQQAEMRYSDSSGSVQN